MKIYEECKFEKKITWGKTIDYLIYNSALPQRVITKWIFLSLMFMNLLFSLDCYLLCHSCEVPDKVTTHRITDDMPDPFYFFNAFFLPNADSLPIKSGFELQKYSY